MWLTSSAYQRMNGHVLFIPGTSGLIAADRINRIAEKSAIAGYGFSCLDAWKDAAELETKTLGIIMEDIERTVSTLAGGQNSLYVIAKSFGAGVLLLRSWPQVSKMVLWAPAIGVTDKSSHETLKDRPLSEVALFDISTDPATLSSITNPILLIRGTEDNVVSQERTSLVLKDLPSAQLLEVPGMGHSPDTPEQENRLIDDSLKFFA